MTTSRREANRINAAKSTGPHDSSSSRYNAMKHGFLSEGVTEIDNPEIFRDFSSKLQDQLKPVGAIEAFLTERIVLGMIRLKRVTALEADCITERLNPPVTEKEGGWAEKAFAEMDGTEVTLDPGLPARLPIDAVDAIASKLGRYETQLENRFFRNLHELERLQRLRCGEKVPAPTSLDVTVHAEHALASFGNPPQQEGES